MNYTILAVLLSIVQTPAPVPRKAPNNHTGAGQTVEQNRQGHQKPSREVVPIPEPAKTDAAKQDARIDSTKNTQQPVRIGELPAVSVKRDWMDKTAIGLTIGLLIIGALGVCAAYRTLKTIEEQLKEIRAAGNGQSD